MSTDVADLTIETARCLIRPLSDGDIDELMVYRSNLEWMRYQGLKGLSRQQWVERLLGSGRLNEGVQLAIVAKQDMRLIGDLYVRRDHGVCWVGYTIAPTHARQGYAYETLTGLIDALRNLGIRAIKAGVVPGNTASEGLLTKLGFTLTGSEDGEDVYVLELPDGYPCGVADTSYSATQSLRLRPVDLSDEAAIADVCVVFRDPATWTHLPAGCPQSDAEVREILARHANSWKDHGLGWWFISSRDSQQQGDGPVVGIGGCALNHPGVPAWNLGFRLDPAVWGHGYASEVAKAGLAAAKAADPDIPVTARVLERNPASWHVLDKSGLTLVWQGDDPSVDPLTTGLPRRVYADRTLDSALLDQLIALG